MKATGISLLNQNRQETRETVFCTAKQTFSRLQVRVLFLFSSSFVFVSFFFFFYFFLSSFVWPDFFYAKISCLRSAEVLEENNIAGPQLFKRITQQDHNYLRDKGRWGPCTHHFSQLWWEAWFQRRPRWAPPCAPLPPSCTSPTCPASPPASAWTSEPPPPPINIQAPINQ